MAVTHQIADFVIDLTFQSGAGSKRTVDDLQSWLEHELLPELDGVLTRYSPGREVLRLDALHLDCGAMTRRNYKQIIQRRLFEELDRIIPPQLLALSPDLSFVLNSGAPPEDAALHQFAGFLQSGQLPWHRLHSNDELHRQLFDRIAEHPQLSGLLQQALETRPLLRRLVRQFSESQLTQVLASLAPGLLPLAIALQDLFDLGELKRRISRAAQSAIQEAQWTGLLNIGLSRNSAAPGATALANLLREWLAAANAQPGALAAALVEPVMRTGWATAGASHQTLKEAVLRLTEGAHAFAPDESGDSTTLLPAGAHPRRDPASQQLLPGLAASADPERRHAAAGATQEIPEHQRAALSAREYASAANAAVEDAIVQQSVARMPLAESAGHLSMPQAGGSDTLEPRSGSAPAERAGALHDGVMATSAGAEPNSAPRVETSAKMADGYPAELQAARQRTAIGTATETDTASAARDTRGETASAAQYSSPRLSSDPLPADELPSHAGMVQATAGQATGNVASDAQDSSLARDAAASGNAVPSAVATREQRLEQQALSSLPGQQPTVADIPPTTSAAQATTTTQAGTRSENATGVTGIAQNTTVTRSTAMKPDVGQAENREAPGTREVPFAPQGEAAAQRRNEATSADAAPIVETRRNEDFEQQVSLSQPGQRPAADHTPLASTAQSATDMPLAASTAQSATDMPLAASTAQSATMRTATTDEHAAKVAGISQDPAATRSAAMEPPAAQTAKRDVQRESAANAAGPAQPSSPVQGTGTKQPATRTESDVAPAAQQASLPAHDTPAAQRRNDTSVESAAANVETMRTPRGEMQPSDPERWLSEAFDAYDVEFLVLHWDTLQRVLETGGLATEISRRMRGPEFSARFIASAPDFLLLDMLAPLQPAAAAALRALPGSVAPVLWRWLHMLAQHRAAEEPSPRQRGARRTAGVAGTRSTQGKGGALETADARTDDVPMPADFRQRLWSAFFTGNFAVPEPPWRLDVLVAQLLTAAAPDLLGESAQLHLLWLAAFAASAEMPADARADAPRRDLRSLLPATAQRRSRRAQADAERSAQQSRNAILQALQARSLTGSPQHFDDIELAALAAALLEQDERRAAAAPQPGLVTAMLDRAVQMHTPRSYLQRILQLLVEGANQPAADLITAVEREQDVNAGAGAFNLAGPAGAETAPVPLPTSSSLQKLPAEDSEALHRQAPARADAPFVVTDDVQPAALAALAAALRARPSALAFVAADANGLRRLVQQYLRTEAGIGDSLASVIQAAVVARVEAAPAPNELYRLVLFNLLHGRAPLTGLAPVPTSASTSTSTSASGPASVSTPAWGSTPSIPTHATPHAAEHAVSVVAPARASAFDLWDDEHARITAAAADGGMAGSAAIGLDALPSEALPDLCIPLSTGSISPHRLYGTERAWLALLQVYAGDVLGHAPLVRAELLTAIRQHGLRAGSQGRYYQNVLACLIAQVPLDLEELENSDAPHLLTPAPGDATTPELAPVATGAVVTARPDDAVALRAETSSSQRASDPRTAGAILPRAERTSPTASAGVGTGQDQQPANSQPDPAGQSATLRRGVDVLPRAPSVMQPAGAERERNPWLLAAMLLARDALSVEEQRELAQVLATIESETQPVRLRGWLKLLADTRLHQGWTAQVPRPRLARLIRHAATALPGLPYSLQTLESTDTPLNVAAELYAAFIAARRHARTPQPAHAASAEPPRAAGTGPRAPLPDDARAAQVPHGGADIAALEAVHAAALTLAKLLGQSALSAAAQAQLKHLVDDLLQQRDAILLREWRKVFASERLQHGLIRHLPGHVLERLLQHLAPDAYGTLDAAFRIVLQALGLLVSDVRHQAIEQAKWQFILDHAFTGGDQRASADLLPEIAQVLATAAELADTTHLLQLVERRKLALSAGKQRTRTVDSQAPRSALRGAREDTSLTQGAHLDNVGMVLAAPFVPRLFAMLKLTENGNFPDPAAAERGMHLLQFLATGQEFTPEYKLLLNKALCGIVPGFPVCAGIDVTPHEKDAIEQLLLSMIQHWKILGSTSIGALRETFLQRQGWLREDNQGWYLEVKPGSFDMLLDQVPWNYSLIKFAWMDKPMHVTWRNKP